MSPRIPRLELDDMAPELAAALGPRVERLGYLGEFFKCMGHQPKPLTAFIDFTETAKSDLEINYVELIALTVASMTGNDYERNQHERLSIRKKLGHNWVRDVESLSPDTIATINDAERALQHFVIEAVNSSGTGTQARLEKVIDHLGYENAISVLMIIGRYVTHALIVNSLDLAPPVPSIWDDGFTGE